MEDTLLITGNQSPLNTSLAKRWLKQGDRIIATVEKEDETVLYPDEDPERLIITPHDRRSPFFSRALFLDLRNKKIELDHVFILFSIMGNSDQLQMMTSRQIETGIDEEIKGFVFLLKESLGHFQHRNGGSINIVIHNTGPSVPAPFDALLLGGIESMSNAFFTYYGREKFQIRGFTDNDHDTDSYAEFICETVLQERPGGKWYNKNKTGFFGFGR